MAPSARLVTTFPRMLSLPPRPSVRTLLDLLSDVSLRCAVQLLCSSWTGPSYCLHAETNSVQHQCKLVL